MNICPEKSRSENSISAFKKTLISVASGLAGFIFAFYSINFDSHNFSLSIVWSAIFPLTAAMAYGGIYGAVAGIAGLGAVFPFFIWSNNGWACFVSFFGYLFFFIWHGYFTGLRVKKHRLWNDPLIIQLPCGLIYALMIIYIYPVSFSYNPPSWAPEALTSIPPHILNAIALKSPIVMYIVTIFSAFLLITPQVRSLMGLSIAKCSRKNGHIFAASASVSLIVWLIMLAFNSVFIEKDLYDNFLSVSSPFEIIGFVVIMAAGLTAGYVIALILEKRYLAEEKIIESEETLRTTFENILDGVLVVDLQTEKFIIANKAICSMLKYSHDELTVLGVKDIHPAADLGAVKDIFERQLSGEVCIAPDISVLCRDGSVFFADINSTFMYLNGRRCMLGVFHDISRRRKSEQDLKTSLKEKEVLLRELYHRTKNNMQVITSMFALWSRQVDDEKAKKVFKDVTSKIKAMSLVHQKLYQSKELSSISLSEYSSELALLFIQIYERKDLSVKLKENYENINALIDIAVPFGLIISELISNSLKHAFANMSEAVIDIKLSKNSKDNIVLELFDNGSGVSQDFNPRAQGGLGIKTVITIVEHQLQGSIKFEKIKGFGCIIEFPGNLYKSRV